jgi:putative restriction endonuclease
MNDSTLPEEIMALKAGIIVVRRQSGYKDVPGVRYHFPKAEYLSGVQELKDSLILLYEPRRGGTSASGGGRSGFVACAFVDRIYDDPADPTHAYLEYRYFCEFVRVVPLNVTSISPKSLQHAVRALEYTEAEEVVRHGLAMEAAPSGIHHGMTDAAILETVYQRETRETVSNRAIRDATFRYRVVEQAYKGRCAFTGVRMLNGNGRAEADAAHIRPVDAGGPDVTQNGLALMKSLHWAFDRGLVSLSSEGRILTVDRGIDEPVLRLLPQDRRAHLPSSPDEKPHEEFLRWHRENVFKGSAVGTD